MGLLCGTDILRLLLSHCYTWALRRKGLDVPMENILKIAEQSKEQEGGHDHRGQSSGSFRKVSWLIQRVCRQ